MLGNKDSDDVAGPAERPAALVRIRARNVSLQIDDLELEVVVGAEAAAKLAEKLSGSGVELSLAPVADDDDG